MLVGRARERAAIATVLAAQRGVLAVEGEPGIGKSRLLAHLAEAAEGCTVLTGRASEFETDLPYALWTDALDRHLAEAGERRVARLGLTDRAARPARAARPLAFAKAKGRGIATFVEGADDREKLTLIGTISR